jgi:hypothetical protein
MIHNLKKLTAVFVFLLFLSKLAHAQSDVRGLYVYTWDVAVDTDPTKPHSALGIQTLLNSLNSPGIDGISLVLNWSSIQTSPTTFEWTNSPPVFQNGEYEGTTSMDKWIQQAIMAHKHILLSVRSGQDMPCWLFSPTTTSTACSGYNGAYAGAVALVPPGRPAGSPSFYVSAHQGRGICTPEWIAAPWDPVFLQQWQTMLSALSAYLKTVSFHGVREYDAITIMRLTGMNRTTDEFRLPAEVLTQCANGVGNSDSVMTWLAAGYRPSLVFKAWDEITDDFQTSFGDKYFNVPLIATNSGGKSNIAGGNGQFPFPPIDEAGCVYLAGIPTASQVNYANVCTYPTTVSVPDQNLPLMTLAAQKLSGMLGAEVENLHFKLNVKTGQGTATTAAPIVFQYAEQLGTAPGYMTNNYFGPFPKNPGGTSCGPLGNLVRCFSVYYGEMLNAGIVPNPKIDASLHSQLIEVFSPDVYGSSGTECSETPPPPPNKVNSTTYQMPQYPPPGCAYPNEIQAAHAQLLSPPLVTITFPAAATATHWYTKLPIGGTVQASSAIGQTTATLNCTGAATGSGADGFGVSVDKEGGPAILRCTATDAAGNQGESIRALWIDTKPPVTTASIKSFPSGATRITLTATDNISGVATTQFRINGGPWTSGTVVGLYANGTYQIDYRSSDVAGNLEKTQTLSVTVVITPPCVGTCGP